MFCVVYEFKVKPDGEKKFTEAWHTVTQDVIGQYGSLGARLHKSDQGDWIAYAQWPDRESWKVGHAVIDAEARQLHVDDCLAEIPTILLKLTVIDDLLQLQPAASLQQTAVKE